MKYFDDGSRWWNPLRDLKGLAGKKRRRGELIETVNVFLKVK
ncbi:hypothetical protein [Planococcus maritimus]|nr:hypothetical protein [Planococcus maritimus]